MAKATTFRCQLITPEAAVLDEPVEFAAFTAHDGEIGFMPNRAPLLTKLGIGELRIKARDNTRRFFIDGGFAENSDNHLTVLTTAAQAAEDIDVRAIEQQIEALHKDMPQTPEARQQRDLDLRRCHARLKIASRAN